MKSTKKFAPSHLKCLICGDQSGGRNFGVISCLACAAFFRLSIVKKREYFCRKGRKCAMDKANRTGCRRCRLEKCLQMGMRRDLVRLNVKNSDSEGSINSPQMPNSVESLCPSLPLVEPKMEMLMKGEDLNLLESLLRMESQFRRVSLSVGEVPRSYFEQFKTLEDLLSSDKNLLNIAHKFSGIPQNWEKEKCLEEIELHGFFHLWPREWTLDHFLSVDMAKSMPFFGQMEIQDRVRLLTALGQSVVYFCNFFYSAQKNEESLTKSDGIIPAAIIQQTKKYGSDPRLVKMSQQLYSNGLAPFRRVALSREEFVLILGIFFSHSAVPGISSRSRNLLYSESTKFAGILFRLLQSQFGIHSGIQRYAELVQLICQTFQLANFYQTYATYLDIFHLGGMREKMLPKVLKPLYSVQI